MRNLQEWLMLIIISATALTLSATNVSTVLDLWNVRNNLTDTYTQTTNIDLAVTNPSLLNPWVASTPYVVGDIRQHPSDGFAYYCTTAHTSGASFNASNWTKMWEAAKGWQPIGSGAGLLSFRGIYDGQNNLIYNLYINRGASPIANNVYPTDGSDNNGLFGYVENTTTYHVYIKNLGLINPNVTGRRATGSLVGRVLLPVTKPARSFTVYIERCFAKQEGSGTATVKGFGATGGLVGANNSNEKQRVPVIRFCYAIVNVSATHPNNVTINTVNDNPNPYNIKYGGLVGCNENGVTQDSFARGSVSGGDRVGGLAGCTIGGSIFRSYATGSATRNISGSWTGGVGGIVGVTSGSLPPGLGGTNQTGSCEDCFWDTEASGVLTSPGGTGKTTLQMKTQSTFTNWDFTNIWNITAGINDGYPFFIGSPSTEFYYRTLASGNWNNILTWQYSSNNSTWNNAVVTPDASNSISILIRDTHTATLTTTVRIDATTIEFGGKLLVANGATLYVDNGDGHDLNVNGILEVTGTMVPGINSTIPFANNSELIYNGSTAQTTGDYFYTNIYTIGETVYREATVYRLTLNNPAGLTFSKAVQVTEEFRVLSGSYSFAGGSTINTDGVYSPNVKYFEFPETGFNIVNFSSALSNNALYPVFVDRQWSINGAINDANIANRTKRITFYWTNVDDQSFDWVGLNVIPAVYAGITKLNTTVGYDVISNPRSITVDIAFSQNKNGAKEDFKIGMGDDETLPVQLSSFTALMYQGNSVMLQWVSQTETELAGYRIYRGNDDNFAQSQMLDTFFDATNTSQAQHYVFYDTELFEPGIYYYWLESVDFDGSTMLFGPANIMFQNPDNPNPDVVPMAGIAKVYPNPFNPSTTIRFGMIEEDFVTLNIYNSRGQKVRTLFEGDKKSGYFQLQWDGTNQTNHALSSGIYLLVMQTNGNTYQQKMVLMK